MDSKVRVSYESKIKLATKARNCDTYEGKLKLKKLFYLSLELFNRMCTVWNVARHKEL